MQNLLIFEVGPYRCAVDKGLVTGIESVGTHRCQGSEKSFRYVVHVDGAEQVICNLPMVFDLDDAIKSVNRYAELAAQKKKAPGIGASLV